MLLTGLSCCATGSRIDMAHHESNAYRALYDTLARPVRCCTEGNGNDEQGGHTNTGNSRSFTHPDSCRVPDLEGSHHHHG